MVMEAWPSISETTFALTPSLKSSVAHVCRRSWKRRSSRTPERSLMRLKERLRRFEDRGYAIETFERHNEEVKRHVPAENLLVYEVGEGWAPLCEFLGVDVPDEPFPHLND